MRFAALFGKEFRECLPWMLLVAIVLLAFGGFTLRAQVIYDPTWQWNHAYNQPGEPMNPYSLVFFHLPGLSLLLFFSAIGLGLILGVRHFWIPNFTRTWPFLLHRSVSRSTVLAAKLSAASAALVLATGGVWTILFWYASRPEVSPIPQPVRIFIHGWIFVMLGLIIYLGTAISGLNEARWYATKILGLAFAVVAIFTITMLSSLGWAFTVIAVSIVLLLSQVFDTFLRREF